MPENYQAITHKQTLDFLEKIIQKAGTFELKKQIREKEIKTKNYLK